VKELSVTEAIHEKIYTIQLTNEELKVLRSQFATLDKAERGRHRKDRFINEQKKVPTDAR